MKKTTVITLLFFSAAIFTLNAQSLQDLLPEADDIEGIADRECEVYEGEALYDLINGGADLVFEYGFIETVKCSYVTDKESDIVTEIYQFEDSYSAYGYFTAMTFTNQKSDAVGTLISDSEFSPVMWDGKYVIMLYTYDETPENSEIIKTLTEEIDSKIEPGSKPEIMRILQSVLPDYATEGYAEGIIGLSNIAELNPNVKTAPVEFAMVYSTNGDMIGCFYYKYSDDQTADKGFGELEDHLRDHSSTTHFEQTDYGFRAEDKKGMIAVCSRSENRFVIAFGEDEILLKETILEKIPEMLENKTASE